MTTSLLSSSPEQLTGAGVPVIEGLVDLRESVENPRFRECSCRQWSRRIEGGRSLSQALAEFRRSSARCSSAWCAPASRREARKLRASPSRWKWEETRGADEKLMLYPLRRQHRAARDVLLMIYLVRRWRDSSANMGQELRCRRSIADPGLGDLRRLLVGDPRRAFVLWGALKFAVKGIQLEFAVDRYKDLGAADRPDPAQVVYLSRLLELR